MIIDNSTSSLCQILHVIDCCVIIHILLVDAGENTIPEEWRDDDNVMVIATRKLQMMTLTIMMSDNILVFAVNFAHSVNLLCKCHNGFWPAYSLNAILLAHNTLLVLLTIA
jgi:hypothetical protein